MKTESIFNNLLAQYCDIAPQDMKNASRHIGRGYACLVAR